jgi:hypothetical protein
MISPIERRRRQLRLRDMENRVATQLALQAKMGASKLKQISSRVTLLRGQVVANCGTTDGQTLKALHEMATRLDLVCSGLRQPIAAANHAAEQASVFMTRANQKREIAAKLSAQSAAAALSAHELRNDANRPARTCARRGRLK